MGVAKRNISTTGKYLSTVFAAVRRGDIERVKLYCQLESFDPSVRDHCGNSLLHFAAEQNDSKLIKCLIHSGSPILARNEDGNTPLHIASQQGSPDSLKTMLMSLPNPAGALKSLNEADNTCLHLASSLRIFKILISNGGRLTKLNKDDESVLHKLAEQGSKTVESLEYVLGTLYDNNELYMLLCENRDGKTPLEVAQDDLSKQLIEEAIGRMHKHGDQRNSESNADDCDSDTGSQNHSYNPFKYGENSDSSISDNDSVRILEEHEIIPDPPAEVIDLTSQSDDNTYTSLPSQNLDSSSFNLDSADTDLPRKRRRLSRESIFFDNQTGIFNPNP